MSDQQGSYRALHSLNVLECLFFFISRPGKYLESLEDDNMTNQFDLMFISIYQCAERANDINSSSVVLL